jgi:SAM-dependent methyltransferase
MSKPSPYAAHHETPARAAGEVPLPDHVLEEIRRTRRHPSPTQPDYVHLRYLLAHIRHVLSGWGEEIREVLDVYCGTRPYEDLLPAGARVTGLDINSRYGRPEVVSSEFLPFADSSFDLVVCYEGFHYVPEPTAGVAEIRRVLRPGGHALVTVPLVWEYERDLLERRYTGPELAELFGGWDDVLVIENGGRAASWALLTGGILKLGEENLIRRGAPWLAVRGAFATGYLTLNAIALQLDRIERRLGAGPRTLPPNLLVAARRPLDG